MKERISNDIERPGKYEPGDYRIKVSAESAKEGITDTFPDFDVENIEYFNEGMGGAIFRVNEEYLFKFAKHEKASNSYETEIEMLSQLAGHISVPIPEVGYSGFYNDGRLRFFGYKEIEGTGLKKEDLFDANGKIKEGMVKQIADFVNEMGAFDVKTAERSGVRVVDPQISYRNQLEDAREEIYPFLEKHYPDEATKFRSFIEKTFNDYLTDEENFEFEPRLKHGDLEGPMAILRSPDKENIAGIIDFGGLEIGDVDLDLWRLYAHYGKEFMETFLRFYPNDDHVQIYKKLEFGWSAQTIHRLVRRIMVEDDLSKIDRSVKVLRERMESQDES